MLKKKSLNSHDMHILITNDDGYTSKGLQALIEMARGLEKSPWWHLSTTRVPCPMP